MSAGSRECLGCGADVSWMAGQSPALWCPRCRPSAEEAYEAGRYAERQEGGREVLRIVGEGLELAMEAGRLAAVRADVAYAAGRLELEAARRRARIAEWQVIVDHDGFLFGIDRVSVREEIAKAQAELVDYSGKAADCRRWLEVTQ